MSALRLNSQLWRYGVAPLCPDRSAGGKSAASHKRCRGVGARPRDAAEPQCQAYFLRYQQIGSPKPPRQGPHCQRRSARQSYRCIAAISSTVAGANFNHQTSPRRKNEIDPVHAPSLAASHSRARWETSHQPSAGLLRPMLGRTVRRFPATRRAFPVPGRNLKGGWALPSAISGRSIGKRDY